MKLIVTILATLAFCLAPLCANAAPAAKRACCQADSPDSMAGMRCCCNDGTKAPVPTTVASLPVAATLPTGLPAEIAPPVMRQAASQSPLPPHETGSPPYLTNCQILC